MACAHTTAITFSPVAETEAVYQQPVIQTAHLQPHTHTRARLHSYTTDWSLSAFPPERTIYVCMKSSNSHFIFIKMFFIIS